VIGIDLTSASVSVNCTKVECTIILMSSKRLRRTWATDWATDWPNGPSQGAAHEIPSRKRQVTWQAHRLECGLDQGSRSDVLRSLETECTCEATGLVLVQGSASWMKCAQNPCN
jgi:hypothetical protein